MNTKQNKTDIDITALFDWIVSTIAKHESRRQDVDLVDYNRSAPVLFEDEIAEILRSCVSGSEIVCGYANEIEEKYYVYQNLGYGITCYTETDRQIRQTELVKRIYDYLESDIGFVLINSKPIQKI